MPTLPVQPLAVGQLATNYTIIVIETIFIILRTASRAVSEAPFSLDDFLVTLTYPVVLGINICEIVMVFKGGAGWRTADVLRIYGTEPLITWLKVEVVHAELYIVALALPRLAIVGLYLRIFIQKPVRIISRVMQVFLIIYPLSFFIALLTICRPISALWAVKPPPGACGNLDAAEIYISIPNIITDVVLFSLPLQGIWKLQLSTKDKLGVLVTLCAGGMGLIVSCLRFSFWYTENLSDTLYVSPIIGKFTSIEAAGYFIAACVPVLKPLVDHLGTKYHQRRRRSQRSPARRSQTAGQRSLEHQQTMMKESVQTLMAEAPDSRSLSAADASDASARAASVATLPTGQIARHAGKMDAFTLSTLTGQSVATPTATALGPVHDPQYPGRIEVRQDFEVTSSRK